MTTWYTPHLCAVLLTFTSLLNGQTFQGGFRQEKVGSVNAPTAMIFSADGGIFVTEKTGQVKIIRNGSATKFYQATVDVTHGNGLYGLALDPDFTKNKYVYLLYTSASNGLRNCIVRVTAKGDVALRGSEKVILETEAAQGTGNNTGGIAFGPDGKLYVSFSCGTIAANAQNLDKAEGKVLRINPDGTIPSDNPFTGSEIARKVWAIGLHNPRTPEVDTHGGRIFINDVCANSLEEINDVTHGGQNFGWPHTEGFSTEAAYTNPLHTYPQGNSALITNEAVAGGTFFNPVASAFPSKYTGKYFFTDYTKRWIGFLDLNNPSIRYSFATDLNAECNYIKAGNDGNLYYLSSDQNAVYRIVYKGPDTVEYYQGDVSDLNKKASQHN